VKTPEEVGVNIDGLTRRPYPPGGMPKRQLNRQSNLDEDMNGLDLVLPV